MCGIVGYLGKRNSKEILLNGLQELEYRGYDSAGVAILESKNNEISNLSIYKAVGKLENLRSKMDKCDINNFNIVLGIQDGQLTVHQAKQMLTLILHKILMWYIMALLKTIKS
jgi:glucosamine 6-phosphate synthetase-like amidotransferase/phosphosugar isomerase protein